MRVTSVVVSTMDDFSTLPGKLLLLYQICLCLGVTRYTILYEWYISYDMIIDFAMRFIICLKFRKYIVYLISYFKIDLIYTSNQNIIFHITILCHCMPMWVLQLQFLITLDHLVDIVKNKSLPC